MDLYAQQTGSDLDETLSRNPSLHKHNSKKFLVLAALGIATGKIALLAPDLTFDKLGQALEMAEVPEGPYTRSALRGMLHSACPDDRLVLF